MNWLSQISPDSVVVVLSLVAGWFGWTAGKNKVVDTTLAIATAVRDRYNELAALIGTPDVAVAKLRVELETAAWQGLAKLGVGRTPVLELAVHSAVDGAFDRLLNLYLTTKLDQIVMSANGTKAILDGVQAPKVFSSEELDKTPVVGG